MLALSRRVSIYVSVAAHCIGTAINSLRIRVTTTRFQNLPILSHHHIPLQCLVVCVHKTSENVRVGVIIHISGTVLLSQQLGHVSHSVFDLTLHLISQRGFTAFRSGVIDCTVV